MVKLLHILYYSMYEWNTKIIKNDDHPEFATGIQIAFFISTLLELIVDVFYYLYTGDFDTVLLLNGNWIFLVLTLCIGFSFWYGARYKKAIKKEAAYWKPEQKNAYRIVTAISFICLIAYLVIMGIIKR